MSKKRTKDTNPLNTAEGLLQHFLVKNEHDVWFLTVDGYNFLPVPRYM